MSDQSHTPCAGNPVPSQQPIDAALLFEHCMDDAALTLMVLAKFEEQAEEHVGTLGRGLQDKDAACVARRAHVLRGTAGVIAATALAEAAQRLEDLALEGQLEDARESLAQLQREVARCLDYLPAARRLVSTLAPR